MNLFKKIDQHKRQLHDDLHNTNWFETNYRLKPIDQYEKFLAIFSNLYNKNFPLEKHTVKIEDIQNPWMAIGWIKKLAKQKQKLNIKFLK